MNVIKTVIYSVDSTMETHLEPRVFVSFALTDVTLAKVSNAQVVSQDTVIKMGPVSNNVWSMALAVNLSLKEFFLFQDF